MRPDDVSSARKMYAYENKYYELGFDRVCGIDEAGRGPLAGPVCAAAVIFPKNFYIEGINDSKKLSENKRNSLYTFIKQNALSYSVQFVTHTEIDAMNILQATHKAMKLCIADLEMRPDVVLIDGLFVKGIDVLQENIVKGDGKSASIAAASILAKVSRDMVMRVYDDVYPFYNFKQHKGYPTSEHIRLIQEHGICDIHRKSFTKKFMQTTL